MKTFKFVPQGAMTVMVVLFALFGFGGRPAEAGTITGNIQTATGGAVANGTLGFVLSQGAVLSGTGTLVTSQVNCYTSNLGNVVGLPDPLANPVLSTNTASGTLASGTYYVKLTYFNASGETIAGPEGSVVLSSQGTVIVAAPVLQPASATGYKVYIGSSSGTETLQSSVSGFGQYQQIAPLVSGAALPGSNTSVCSIAFSDTLVPTGTSYRVSLTNKNGAPLAGFPQTWCTYGGLSGTINVSIGAPTGNCSTSGVFYPTPIFANQQNGGGTQTINGTLNISQNMSIGGNLNVVGTITSTGGWNGAFTAKSVNSVKNAAFYLGADMGAQINAAIADFSGACGRVIVPTATYAVSTQIRKPKCIDLDLQGSVLNFTASSLPVIITGDSGVTTSFTMGAIRNGVINGAGAVSNPLGIWLGGDSGGTSAPTNYTDFLDSFVNVTVQNFAAAYKVGYKAYQIYWIGGIIQQNTWGIQNANQFYSENMNLHGTQIFNNTGNGLVVDAGSDFHLYGVSLDYNAGGAIQLQSGGVSMQGGNIEQLSGLAINSPASANALIVGLYNVRMALTDVAGSQAAFMAIAGTNSNLTADGLHLIHLHAVTEVVNWTAAGTANSATLHFHDDSGTSILPTSAAPNIQNLTFSAPWLPFTSTVLNATSYLVNGTPTIVRVGADFTTAANTSLQTITGLTWTLVANLAQNVPFSCHLLYSQATGAVADQFGVQSAGLAPTLFVAKARVQTNSTAFIAQNLPGLASTTATAVVTFTPSAITTIWEADISGLIENPSGVSTAINIMAQTSNAADLLTVKRGSFCRVY